MIWVLAACAGDGADSSAEVSGTTLVEVVETGGCPEIEGIPKTVMEAPDGAVSARVLFCNSTEEAEFAHYAEYGPEVCGEIDTNYYRWFDLGAVYVTSCNSASATAWLQVRWLVQE